MLDIDQLVESYQALTVYLLLQLQDLELCDNTRVIQLFLTIAVGYSPRLGSMHLLTLLTASDEEAEQ